MFSLIDTRINLIWCLRRFYFMLILIQFVTKSGRSLYKTFLNDSGLDKKFQNTIKQVHKNPENFKNNHDKIHNVVTGLIENASNLKLTDKLALKATECAISALLNPSSETSLSAQAIHNTVTHMQPSVRWIKTRIHTGQPTTKRVRKQLNVEQVYRSTKILHSSSKDYISHSNRKYLNSITTGFNQRLFCFLGEHTYCTVEDWLQLLDPKEEMQQKFQNADAVFRVRHCVESLKVNFKIRNEMPIYSCAVVLHQVFIKNTAMGLEDVIQSTFGYDSKTAEVSRIYRSEKPTDSGRIPRKQILKQPTYDEKNRITTNIITTLDTSIFESVNFTDNCKVLNSFRMLLEPKTTWDVSVTQSFGSGILFNKLVDLNTSPLSTKEHPVGNYVWLLELIGDRRGSVSRIRDSDGFRGFSPAKLSLEFTTSLRYIAKQPDPDPTKSESIVYYNTRPTDPNSFGQDDNGSALSKYFYPTRKETNFNVNFDDILITTPEMRPTKSNKKDKKFVLDYNVDVIPTNGLINTAIEARQEIFDQNNDQSQSINDLTEDDVFKFNFTNPPTSSGAEEENFDQSTDDEDLNLDNDDSNLRRSF